MTAVGESHGQATKRRVEELSQAHDDLGFIFRTIRGQDEERAASIFQRIRAADSPRKVINYIEYGNLHQPHYESYERRLRETFIITLAQSTAPLTTIVDISASWLNPKSSVSLPSSTSLRELQDCIVTLDVLHGLMNNANANANARHESGADDLIVESSPSSQGDTMSSSSSRHFYVPALPWTNVTKDNAAVSHLVVIFLNYINPYWRLV